ncbi:DUF3828 domain-containing protein [Rahnella sp. L72c]|uniref:DUF3828 domain-containing protein n=1 Tax=Rahnella perminowiae TaxID=2816244 RepID=A0ABS6L5H0_9GAMM|nr:DUF3828 domain-containing protein [Rahnella perminowiae]MBU9836863.1 DUF3828 domain-containing protein [Rahnella perminowiae]
MRRYILAAMMFTCVARAETTPQQQAEIFYRWYIQQVSGLENPLENPKLSGYVEHGTYAILMKAYKANEIDVDYFTKVQDFDDKDWLQHITAEKVVIDPVCTNVYMSFGLADRKRVVACFVRDKGGWKIRSVTDLP